MDSDLLSHPPSSRTVGLPLAATAWDKLNKPSPPSASGRPTLEGMEEVSLISAGL